MKPILMNTDMVHAILDGRKTVTRRVVKPRYREDEGGFQVCTNKATGERWIEKCDWDEGSFDTPRYVNPPYRPGDILYVRETWTSLVGSYLYRADQKPGMKNPGKWRPSIHMPREAARIFLRVTDVRVERLQDSFGKHGSTIFEIRSEGINIPEDCRECIDTYGSPCCIDTTEDDGSECGMLDYPRSDFADLWDSTLKPQQLKKFGWTANPWVWRVEFERCAKPKEAKS